MSVLVPAADALIRGSESLSLTPYLCPAGWPTIGYGHVIASLDHPPITEAQANALLEQDEAIARAGALRHCPVLGTEDPRRLGAIASFVFNLGSGRLRASTLRRRINEERWEQAERELQKWVYAGARKLNGLVLRRKKEGDLLMLRVPSGA